MDVRHILVYWKDVCMIVPLPLRTFCVILNICINSGCDFSNNAYCDNYQKDYYGFVEVMLS